MVMTSSPSSDSRSKCVSGQPPMDLYDNMFDSIQAFPLDANYFERRIKRANRTHARCLAQLRTLLKSMPNPTDRRYVKVAGRLRRVMAYKRRIALEFSASLAKQSDNLREFNSVSGGLLALRGLSPVGTATVKIRETGLLEQKVCVCNTCDGGQLICCDSPSCLVRWYHWSCVGIDDAPTDGWSGIECEIRKEEQMLKRLEQQRLALNDQVKSLKEEIAVIQEASSGVGVVVNKMGGRKCLVKIQPDGKYVVNVEDHVEYSQLKPGIRVALRADTSDIHRILPTKVDPIVSLMMVEKVPDSTYSMIGGLDEQIKEIREVIEMPIKHPELFENLGISQPKGVLLYGPPGTGKTLLARAVAHHTRCKFIRVSGSELVQKYIGEGSRLVRELFIMAREHAPSIIFMDEIDSIGSARTEGGKGSDSEVQRTMLELLNQLDGFESCNKIKVIMATNRIDILDPALLRTGRIDRKIEFPAPKTSARLEILKIHSRKMNLTKGINLDIIAEALVGSSGAEVKAVCTEAGMFALRERRVHVTQEDFEMAVSKVMKKSSDAETAMRKLLK